MPLVSRLLRSYLLGRAHGAHRRRGRRYGYGSRRRARGGFVGPFPAYTRHTRRGSRVTVGGCCLPIPLSLALTAALGVRTLLRR